MMPGFPNLLLKAGGLGACHCGGHGRPSRVTIQSSFVGPQVKLFAALTICLTIYQINIISGASQVLHVIRGSQGGKNIFYGRDKQLSFVEYLLLSLLGSYE